MHFCIANYQKSNPGTEVIAPGFFCCSCPGTKGQWDKETVLSRDKGTMGHPVPNCHGTSCEMSRPLETLISTIHSFHFHKWISISRIDLNSLIYVNFA